MSKEEKQNIFAPICKEMIEIFGVEHLIPHKWLKEKFGIDMPDIKDFDSTLEFLAEVDKRKFLYMSLIVDLQDVLLKKFSYYMRNVQGEGYIIVSPEEQAQYGYDWFCNEVQKAAAKANAILTFITPTGNSEIAAKNADLKAKLGRMKLMFKELK